MDESGWTGWMVDADLVEMLDSWRDARPRLRCGYCKRVFGRLHAHASLALVFLEDRPGLPVRPDGVGRERVRRAYMTVGSDAPNATTATYRCRCGRSTAVGGERLTMLFIAAARAGGDVLLGDVAP